MDELTWVVEVTPFEGTASRLIAALEQQGRSWTRFEDGAHERRPADGSRTVFYGSLNVGVELARERRWSPGVICNVERLCCSAYYPRMERWLLNTGSIFTTVRELTSDPARVAVDVATEGVAFVRPDSPLKQFSGRLVELDGLTPSRLDHGFYYQDLDLPIVVSPVREVGQEWRFVVTEGLVVTGCGYEPEGRSASVVQVPEDARLLAEEIARSAWRPDPIFVVDICGTPEGPKLLELNSFSCSDLYSCDFDAIIAAIDRLDERS